MPWEFRKEKQFYSFLFDPDASEVDHRKWVGFQQGSMEEK